jgi:hypothetical protein
MQNKEKADRDVRGRRNSDKRDLELMKNAEAIKEAREQNKILREARRAAEAVAAASAAATAGPGFRGPGPPGQSSQGKGPAAAAAGDDRLTEYQKELLHRNRLELQNPTSKKFKKQLRMLVYDPDGSDAEETDDDQTKKRRTRSKPKPLTLEFEILVQELYDALITNPRGPWKKAKGGKGEAKGGKDRIMLQFTDIYGSHYEKLKLRTTDNDDCISPTEVVKVFCDDCNDLNFEWTRDTYAEQVARLPPDHTVVNILRRKKIVIPKLPPLGHHQV